MAKEDMEYSDFVRWAQSGAKQADNSNITYALLAVANRIDKLITTIERK